MEEAFKLFKKTTIYVVRCDSKNNLQDSAPCENCLSTIVYLNIKRIVFSSKNNDFVSCAPCDLEISHISAGNKFLEKRFRKSNLDEIDKDKENKNFNFNKKKK